MKKYANIILSVILLVSMAFGMVGCSEKGGVVDPEMYDKAVSAMESGNYEEAYDLFIKLDPNYQDVKEYLSHFYFVPVSGSMEYFSYGERVVESTTEISYNEYGLPILIVEKNRSGAENWAHTYEYDDKGRVVYEAYEKRGQFSYDIKYTYNELDQLVKITKKLAGSSVTITENTYDENGNMVKTDEVYGSGSPYTTVYSYDEFGRLISSHNTNVTYQYFYDAAGNLVREELVNYEGKTTVNTYEYDSQGRLIKESRDNSSREYIYDENGNLCKKTNISEVGTARLETVFDANGRPKKRTNVNYNGDYFTYRFKYDKYGCMTYCSFGGNSFDKREYKIEYKLVYIPYDEIPSEALRVINILDAFV